VCPPRSIITEGTGNVETSLFPRGVDCGLRKLTTNHLLAARLAEQASGLPQGVKHPNQLLASLRRAAPYLGYTRLLPLMEALFRWTQPQDWAAGAEPIVWPSNDDLATALDCSERHVSRLISAAIEARLIVAKDGTDRKRRGFRQDGNIVWAWGLNLRPIAGRHTELLAAAEDGERARRLCRELRRQASRAQQFLTQLLLMARQRGFSYGALEDTAVEAQSLAGKARRTQDPEQLADLVRSLQFLADSLRRGLEEAVEHADMSGSVDPCVRPILLTNTPTEPKGSTVAAQEPSAQVPAASCRTTASAQEAELYLSPGELVRLAPRLEHHLTTANPDWSDVSDAAAALARHLGIPQALYGEACRNLGRHHAAVAVAVISTKSPVHFHTAGPGGYLRGMLRRAERGELFLNRSIHGLRDVSARHLPEQLTAVNSGRWRTTASKGAGKVRYSQARAPRSASASGNHG
jgi:replication initiation protein RepC